MSGSSARSVQKFGGKNNKKNKNMVWPEILAGKYFGRIHLAEFTLAVEPVLAIMIFITKWLVKCARNLPGRELVSAQLRQN